MMATSSAAYPDRRYAALLWGTGSVLLGLTVAFLLARGDIRSITLLLLGLLGLLCLAPRRGVFILLAFLPFMYFLRRQVLHFNEFSKTDPILLFPPLVTIAMFLGFIIFYSERFYRYLRRSLLMRMLLALQVLYCVQMFNPLQGSILVGIAGALYFVIPMLWVFMGLLLDERDLRKIFAMIILIGTVTAAYGIYQHYFGFSDVERYELESKGFLKSFGEKVRAMSTFAGLGDFSVYLSLSGFLAFAHYWRTRKNALYLAVLGIIGFALLWVAIRTSIFILLFSILVYLIVYARDLRLIVVRGLMALLVVGSLYGYLYTYTPQEVFGAHRSSNPFIVHTVAGLAHPTEESTFHKRLLTWGYIVRTGLTEYPFGRGLGSTTTAAMKFAETGRFEADSYFFEIIYGSGPLAAVLFVVIFYLLFRDSLSLVIRADENFTYRVVVGLVAAYFLGSLFGIEIRDPVNGPLAWLTIGWMVKESVDRSEEAAGASTPAAA